MKNFSSAIDSMGKIKYPEIQKIAGFASAVNQIKYPEIQKIAGFASAVNQIKYPEIQKIAGFASAAHQIKYPEIQKIAGFASAVNQIKYPEIQKIAGFASAVNQIKYPEIQKFAGFASAVSQMKYPEMEKLIPLAQSLSTFSNKISEIDWESFELTDEDIKLSNNILESDKTEEIVSKELSENIDPKKISKSIINIILLIYYFVDFLSSLTQVAQYVEETVIPVVQSYTYHEKEGFFQSEKTSVKWMNDELKKDVSNQITKNFRIVSKNNLLVREGQSRDSRITGKLNAGHVVQIVEKRRNWTYVIYSNYEEQQVIEGWVLTRYLRQIK